MTVADLLLRSRTAAQNALKAKRGTDVASVYLLYQEALETRRAAHAADPEHADPAWHQDARNHRGELKRERGQTATAISQAHHAKLMAFFESQLSAEFVPDSAEVEINRDWGEPDKTKHVGPVKETVTFLKRVTPAVPVAPLSEDEMDARVLAPEGVAKADTAAHKQLLKERGQ